MKIRKIKFKNINSLRGEHEIDFTSNPLAQSRLFAITGPTGSGKSTILDVVALALFNQVPRLGKVSKKMVEESGAILTRNTTDAFASVEYHCSGGVYRSTWRISTNRNQGLRDYEMELADISTGKNIDLKKSEVPRKNEELIGLSYDQFIKSILLAQGEFAKFLKVSKSERGELLEKITGTSIYRTLGKKAFEKKGLFAKKLEELRKEESIFKDQLLSEEQLEENQQLAKHTEADIKLEELKIRAVEQQISLQKEMDKTIGAIAQRDTAIKTKRDSLDAFNEAHAKRLEKHEATALFAEELSDWKLNKATQKEASDALIKRAEEIESKRNQRTILVKQVSNLVKQPVSETQVKEQLSLFQSKVEELIAKEQNKRNVYIEQLGILRTKGERFDFEPNSKEPAADQEKLLNWDIQAKEQQSKLKQVLKDVFTGDIDQDTEKLNVSIRELSLAKGWSVDWVKMRKLIDKEQKEQKEKQALIALLPTAIQELKQERDKGEILLKNARLEFDNQQLRASLEEHRANLEDGKPCPLCGAESHPWATHVPKVDNYLSGKIVENEKVLSACIQKLSTSEAQLVALQRELEQIGKRLNDYQIEKSDLESKIRGVYTNWKAEEEVDWDTQIALKESQKQLLKTLSEVKGKIEGIAVCVPVLQEMVDLKEEGLALSKEREKLFSGNNIKAICDDLREKWTTTLLQLDNLEKGQADIQEKLTTSLEREKQLEMNVLPNVHQAGFTDFEDALASRLNQEEYQRLTKQHADLKQQMESLQVEKRALTEQLAEHQTKRTAESTGDLQIQLNTANDALKGLREIAEEVNRKLKNHGDNLTKINTLQEQISKEEQTGRKWELLNQLIGDATGKKFNDFAQDLTLQRLLVLANNRLSQLIDRYQIASPQPDEDDSLVVIDNHMGGQRRSVKTLSGGETFILSLSLALALSDLASKTVEINSLFIDEGFGTLDPETLDQTIDTLEKLQAESSKTIGIISHVEALKERISTQIQLEQNGQGFSKIKVA